MECHEARLLIDERVHGTLAGGMGENLDEHLRNCADCRTDLRQLESVRGLLAAARKEAPPAAALSQILNQVRHAVAHDTTLKHRKEAAMSSAAAARLPAPISLSARRWRFVAAASIAAVALLMVSFVAGTAIPMSSPRHASVSKVAPLAQTETASGLGWEDRAGSSLKSEPPAGGAWREGEYSRSDKSADTGRGTFGSRNSGGRPPIPAAPPSSTSSSGGRTSTSSSSGGGSLDDDFDAPTAAPALDAPKAPALNGNKKGKDGRFGDPKSEGKNEDSAAAQGKPKIIKTGELTVEVKNYVEANRAVDALVMKHQGFLADSRSYDLPGATKSGVIVIRVAPENFEALFSELKKLGAVLQERAGGQDITAQYTDTEARIKNLLIAEERLQELIKSKTFMDKVQSLLEVERELSRVRGEVESMQGQMRVWNNQLALSTIRLTLQEPSRAVPSGSLSVEVPNLVEAKKQLDAALTNANAQLLNGQNTKRPDGTLMGTYTLRIKFGRFAELTAAIKALGLVRDEAIQNQPFAGGIPEGAQDVPCDLSLVLFERSIQLPSGSLNLEVPTVAAVMPKLNVALAGVQATIVSNQTQRQPDGSTTAQIAIRVSAGNFNALLDALAPLGRITHRQVGGEASKVQGGAAEVPCTLNLSLYEERKQVPSGNMSVEVAVFTESRDKLSALIKEQGLQVLSSDSQQRPDNTWAGAFRLGIKADKMDAVVSEIEKLGRVKTRQLQGLGLGDLSKVDPNVIGEVLVVIEERPAIAPQEEGSFRLLMRETFGGFLTSMGYIVRGFAMILPWLLAGGLVVWLIWRASRKAVPATPATTPAPETKDAEKK